MIEHLRVSDVFVPGRLPAHTYNPREHLQLEIRLQDYIEEAGDILTVAGPTKTGKSVLLQHVLDNPAWVDSQGIDSVNVLWTRLADELGVWSRVGLEVSRSDTGEAHLEGEGGFAPVAKLGAGGKYAVTDATGDNYSVERPLGPAVKEALRRTRRPVVIDDFHFVARGVQREIVRALKPLVLAGVPIMLVSISHRLRDVVAAEPDMGGRVRTLDVSFWELEDLLVISRKGFEVLNIEDVDDAIGQRLASESYGSPHLMQQFCREVCKGDGIRESLHEPRRLRAPDDWSSFFTKQLDEASRRWFERLLRGPQERGSQRTQWQLRDSRTLDGYGLTLAAIAETGPSLEISKDRLKEVIEELTAGNSPATHQTTRVLKHMSLIAAKRASGPTPTEEELDAGEEDSFGMPDAQPVLEYVDQGPASKLHIADPFFAFFMRWGSPAHLVSGEGEATLWHSETLPEPPDKGNSSVGLP